MAKQEKAYLGLPWIVSLILAIIPITSFVLGIVTAFQRNNIVFAVIRILGFFFYGFIIWILDIVSMVIHKDLKWLA
ncbi:MAG: hypothetical protein FWE31_03060 [Firmicutes bacterium]|nr:hypothetical protein [Bacillota bacterium]